MATMSNLELVPWPQQCFLSLRLEQEGIHEQRKKKYLAGRCGHGLRMPALTYSHCQMPLNQWSTSNAKTAFHMLKSSRSAKSLPRSGSSTNQIASGVSSDAAVTQDESMLIPDHLSVCHVLVVLPLQSASYN